MGITSNANAKRSDLERDPIYRRKLKVFASTGDLFTVEEIRRCLRKSPTTIRKDLQALREEMGALGGGD
ncbi:Z-DNA binding protein 1/DNA complex dlM1-Z-DNA compleX [Caudoviricetes sp.]|nr:Z-DNA binding protein 1/DNA complex dlM1-Z-DNA compleX [Caudoviricetes sp.]